MSTTTTTPTPPAPAPVLDIDVINNGVKLLGEAVVPGASLLLEKHIAAGLGATAIGVLGSAALGSLLGPVGFLIGRYGTSAAAFSLSIQQPVPKNGSASAAQSVANSAATISDAAKSIDNHMTAMRSTMDTFAATVSQAPAFRAASPAPAAAAAPPDLADHIVSAIRQVMPELAQSVRSAMEDTQTRRPTPRTT